MTIRAFISAQQSLGFSYPEVGATRGKPPRSYTVDHNRVRLGSGPEVFDAAITAVREWRMFQLGWVELCWPDAPISPGSTVAVLTHQLGFWSLNACRIVYVVEEAGQIERYGFAYGTLPEHVERGEERFTVEWHHADDSVWYDILALSRPNQLLPALGYPLTRLLQRRFAQDSKRAMVNAVSAAGGLSDTPRWRITPRRRSPMPVPIILDCDPGVDDALALLLAARSPELELLAVTTVAGNVPVDVGTENALRALAVAGVEAPVYQGEAAPLRQPLVTALEIHGEDGLGGASGLVDERGAPLYRSSRCVDPLPAPEAILELLAARPEAEIVAVGPLTNLARAAERDRERMRRVKRITVMGGAFRVYGNTSAVAEFNLYVDPDAAQAVLDLGVPVTLVPLDVSERVILYRRDLDGWQAAGMPHFVTAITDRLMNVHQELCGFDGCYLHDPLALATVIDPSLVETVEAEVGVETEGRLTRGMTVADLRPGGLFRGTPNARVAVEVDAERFRRLFLQRLRQAPEGTRSRRCS